MSERVPAEQTQPIFSACVMMYTSTDVSERVPAEQSQPICSACVMMYMSTDVSERVPTEQTHHIFFDLCGDVHEHMRDNVGEHKCDCLRLHTHKHNIQQEEETAFMCDDVREHMCDCFHTHTQHTHRYTQHSAGGRDGFWRIIVLGWKKLCCLQLGNSLLLSFAYWMHC